MSDTVDPTVPAPDGGTPDTGPPPTHVPNAYDIASEATIKALQVLIAQLPKLTIAHPETARFVKTHKNVPLDFVATALASAKHAPTLNAANQLDLEAVQDGLNLIRAYRPLGDVFRSMANAVFFTADAVQAEISVRALQLYDTGKALSRDVLLPQLVDATANMKRDLKRTGGRPRKGGPTTNA